MTFEHFLAVEFPPINREVPSFVYVLFWAKREVEVPFYVGQTNRIWGRLDDYYWPPSWQARIFARARQCGA